MRGLVFSDRVSAGITALADIANAKPLLTMENGVLVRAGLLKTCSEGMDKLYQFVKSNLPHIQDLAISYSTVQERANEFKKRLVNIFPEKNIYLAQLGAALGAHGGSSVLIVALRLGTQSD